MEKIQRCKKSKYLILLNVMVHSQQIGRRRSQGGHRLHLRLIELDPADGRIKVNPLANWGQVRLPCSVESMRSWFADRANVE
jgi:hypothetical protein